jgi:hypothetical protein
VAVAEISAGDVPVAGHASLRIAHGE